MADTETVVTGVAGRYASALFELARDSGAVDPVRADLERFTDMVEQSDDLRRLVKSPVFTAEDQTRALGAVLDKAGVTGLAGNFLRLVASKRRLFAAQDMVKAYGALADQAAGLARAEVTVAHPPSDSLRAEIETSVAQVAGSKVAIDLKVDPGIIGGIVVKLGSRMVDASLRTKLNGIRLAMKEAG